MRLLWSTIPGTAPPVPPDKPLMCTPVVLSWMLLPLSVTKREKTKTPMLLLPYTCESRSVTVAPADTRLTPVVFRQLVICSTRPPRNRLIQKPVPLSWASLWS